MTTPKSWHDRSKRDLETEAERWRIRTHIDPAVQTHAFVNGVCIFDRKPLDEHSGTVIYRGVA